MELYFELFYTVGTPSNFTRKAIGLDHITQEALFTIHAGYSASLKRIEGT